MSPKPWRRAAAIVSGGLAVLLAPAGRADAATVEVVALVGKINDVLTNIQVWLTGLLLLLATVALLFGAVRYLAGSGEPGEVEKAKQAMKNAGKGYLLAALAPVIVEILRGFVGA
ncbi:hypothetical protein [Kutzneria sp. NPDC052558]|uniref:hypothetical protein n=1 Tax=Kutzneria sp. NPDC052558 TaxID=3364121 RepID=UPI0037C97DDD